MEEELESLLDHICSHVLTFERNQRRKMKGIIPLFRNLFLGEYDYSRLDIIGGNEVYYPIFVINNPMREYDREEIDALAKKYDNGRFEGYEFRIYSNNRFIALKGWPKGSIGLHHGWK